jgi:large subunit ribosomal protein L19
MVSQVIDKINAEQVEGSNVPPFHVGDTVRVHVRIREGEKERIQVFPGTVIARDGGSSNETFTVRRISHGVGVERVFPVHSPHLAKIEVEREGKVKRAKLYFLRNLTGRKARMKIRSRR